MQRDRLRARSALLLLLLVVPIAATAQPPAMSGVVRHAASGKPIECLHVALADSLDRTVVHTVTDANGTFVAVAPDTGTFRVRFIVAGLEPMQGPLLHLTSGLMMEQEYPVSFDHLIPGEYEIRMREHEPAIDLGEWRSARPAGNLLGAGSRPASPSEALYEVSRAIDQARAMVEFIVDSTGRPRSTSWRTIVSSNPSIVQHARSTYLRMRFDPAHIGQQRVCELVIVELRSFRTTERLR